MQYIDTLHCFIKHSAFHKNVHSHHMYTSKLFLQVDACFLAETCGLDDVFPPDDLGSDPCTPFIIYIPHIIATFLLIKLNSFKETYIQKVG